MDRRSPASGPGAINGEFVPFSSSVATTLTGISPNSPFHRTSQLCGEWQNILRFAPPMLSYIPGSEAPTWEPKIVAPGALLINATQRCAILCWSSRASTVRYAGIQTHINRSPPENKWKNADAWIMATCPNRSVKLLKCRRSGLVSDLLALRSSSSDERISPPKKGTGKVDGSSLNSLNPRSQKS
jgi:hypothetical protein